jgi:Raf kinase inhibitor-like YbhB/YbcL family protein
MGMPMTITSTAFQNNDPIPAEYSYDGRNVNPPLTFSEVPREAKSLLLIVEDPDAPNGTFTHWILYNMSPATLQILEGELPLGAQQATNDFGTQGYGGPKPPPGQSHRYVFKLFALDTTLKDARSTDRRQEIATLMEGHVITEAHITGLFSTHPTQ